jgi:hypothetical protein
MRPFSVVLVTLLLATSALWLLGGCGSGADGGGPRREVPGISGSTSPIAAASAEATAQEVDYQGWRALRLTNGMVTVVAVPDLGGRIVEYKLGGHPFLWANPAERGKTYPAPRTEADRAYHDFGGYKLWPVASARWQGPPDPFGSVLDSGQWTGKILTAGGRNVEVELRSPEDKVTGLQITRNIKLFGASSQVRVTEKITNISNANADWAFCGLAQVPGSLDGDAAYSEKARLYLPLNPETKHEPGYVTLTSGGTSQFKVLADHLLQVSFQRQEGRIGADTYAGWLAYVDEEHEFAFVQRFAPAKLSDYPEQGSTVIVETSGKQAYMTTGVCTPVTSLKPGESLEMSMDWFATRVGGPVVATSDVAAIREPLKVVRENDKTKITGNLGVLLPGNLAFILQDAEGKAIGQPTTLKVSPAEVVKLAQELPAEAQAKTVVIELQNDSGTPLGEIAKLSLAVTIAAAQ